MNRLRRGAILGFGAVAEHGHLPGWKSDARFEIVAVAEPQPERRAQALRALPAARVYDSVAALLAAEPVDFVDIASPPAFHAEAIVAAATAGAHVLCEKPLVTRLDEFRRIQEATRAAGVALHPVHNWKHAEAYRILRGLTGAPASPSGSSAPTGEKRTRWIGAPRELVFRVERNGWSVSEGDWRADRRLGGGGILVDHGWHAFYLAMGLAGAEPRAVRATTEQRRYRDAEVEDTALCEIEFGDCQGRIELSWAGHVRETSWTVRGSGGTAEIRDAALYLHCGDEETVQGLDSSLSHGSHHADWFPGVIDSFAAAIEDPCAAAEAMREAAWCVTLLEAAYTSAARGGVRVEVAPPQP
jgi:predicted dehydrogenase